MNVNIFVDTNILVYYRDSSEPEKQPQAREWLARLWETGCGRLSFQVLQEFYVTVTQKLKPGLDIMSAQADVRALLTWQPLPVDGRVMESAWFIQARYGLGWWDALIVAAAQLSGCCYLLTEDLQDEQFFGPMEVINPFRREVESLAW